MRLGFTVHTRIQTGVKAFYRSWLFSAKEDKFGSISRKVHDIGVWDAEGILFIDYLEKGKTITREYYFSLLTRLDQKIHEKRPSLQKKHIIFYQDHAPCCIRREQEIGSLIHRAASEVDPLDTYELKFKSTVMLNYNEDLFSKRRYSTYDTNSWSR
jgi:hypothetical protein